MFVFLGDSITEWPGGYVDLLAGHLASAVNPAGQLASVVDAGGRLGGVVDPGGRVGGVVDPGGRVGGVVDAGVAGDRLEVVNTGVAGDGLEVVNAGVAGDRLEHLLQRWSPVFNAASVLTIYAGVNDTLVAFFEGTPTPPDVFESRFTDLLTRAAAVPRVIVVEPFFLAVAEADAPWRDGLAFARSDLDSKRPIVRRLAANFGATFVPLQDRFDVASLSHGAAAVAPDGVHPSPLGHRLIADAWLAAW